MNISLTFDLNLYSMLAVEKACYRFSDRFACIMNTKDSDLIVELSPKRKDMSDEAREIALNDFKTEVLDQNLREKIKTETAPVRNLILAHAFSRTGLIGQ
ncbi:His-Xaa-Ser system protein HxsD [Variovorax sp. LjRoot178]|uniref:His-Xaa-Ser system protein HxsD n=1 Tax=Variovorax sp. LjRoot178 TaxID=3342277 RepID=UPI003ECEC9CA